MARKLMLLQGGSERPFPGEVTATSANTPWPGFPMESYVLGGQGCIEDFDVPAASLTLCVRGRSQFTVEERSGRSAYEFTPGKLCAGPSGRHIKAFRWDGQYEAILVQLSTPRLPLTAGGSTGTLGTKVSPRGGFRDPQLQQLIMLMFADVRAGCPQGTLYGESLSLALIEYLRERYCVADQRSTAERMALSAAQLKKVHDYIVANLGADLTVVGMAALLDLSPSHFTVLFRNATGRTPHQYVLAERIAAGRRQIESGSLSLAEIALALGFSSQSHFATSFRRAIGMTPREYQRSRGARGERNGRVRVTVDELPGQG